MINISAQASAKLEKLRTASGDDWISTLLEIGEEPETFFEDSDWTGTDFSMSDMSRVSFKGATIDHCIFRAGDVSGDRRAAALSAVSVQEVTGTRVGGSAGKTIEQSSTTRDHADLDEIHDVMIKAALEAGRYIMKGFGKQHSGDEKEDGSPVTEYDLGAEEIIRGQLASFHGIPIVGEETVYTDGSVQPTGSRFFLVDPLDGTQEFKAGLSDFTVNIALIDDGAPVLGVIFIPLLGELFIGSAKGAFKAKKGREGDYSNLVSIEVAAHTVPMIVASRTRSDTSQMEEFKKRYPGSRVDPIGSSIKFCRVAEGKANLYPCFGPTYEWDTAAGQAVLEAAGGHVRDLEGRSLRYGKQGREDIKDFLNGDFIASGGCDPFL